MEIKFWKTLAGLGLPGVALGVFYKLYDKFDWPLAKIPPDKMFILVLFFMAIVAAVVLCALFLWRPRSGSTHAQVKNTFSMSIPKAWKFKATADKIAGKSVVEFIGFTDAELGASMQAKDLEAPNEIEALRLIHALTDGKVRRYQVDQTSAGKYVLRVV